MKAIDIYYNVRPIIPRYIQVKLRQYIVQKKRKKLKDKWPINGKENILPDNWNGWPDNAKFALVITHDVDTQKGFDQTKQLMNFEISNGIKSSYNFVPERYTINKSIFKELINHNFEIGVHGLNHDGKLFKSKKIFNERALKINKYIKEWNAIGFRAPAMHHNLEWIHKLDIEYDSSTFDNDPFEPMSDGVNTIIPFKVQNIEDDTEYIELPYTIPQDFTVFILLQEKNIQIWKRKVDWIADNGGMALVNLHPDYMNFENRKNGLEEYSIQMYLDFINYIKTKYKNQYWNALPKEIAEFVRQNY